MLSETLGTKFSEISNEIHTCSFKKTHFKISPANWRSFCTGIDELTLYEHSFIFFSASDASANWFAFKRLVVNNIYCHRTNQPSGGHVWVTANCPLMNMLWVLVNNSLCGMMASVVLWSLINRCTFSNTALYKTHVWIMPQTGIKIRFNIAQEVWS